LSEVLTGPVLTAAAVLVAAWLLIRLVLYLRGPVRLVLETGRVTALTPPLARILRRRPVALVSGCLLHLGLLLVAFGLPYHSFALLELDEPTGEVLTLIMIGLVLLSIFRPGPTRDGGFRLRISKSIPALVILVTLASGYLMAFSSSGWSWLDARMPLIHVLSVLILLVLIGFLTTASRLDPAACTGCAACHWNCPTGAIGFKQSGDQYIFTFEGRLCLRCGQCVSVCPENAARIQHRLKSPQAIISGPAEEIARARLLPCTQCGGLIAPERLVGKTGTLTEVSQASNLCQACQEKALVEYRQRLEGVAEG